jgi:hypothetical protein
MEPIMPEGSVSHSIVTIGGQEVAVLADLAAAPLENTAPPKVSIDLEMASTPAEKQTRERTGYALLAFVLLALAALLVIIFRLSERRTHHS